MSIGIYCYDATTWKSTFSDLIELFLGWSVVAEHLFYIQILRSEMSRACHLYITSYKGKRTTYWQRPSQASSCSTYLISTIFCMSISLILYISSVHRPILFADKQIRKHARQYLKLPLSRNPRCKIILGVRLFFKNGMSEQKWEVKTKVLFTTV